MRATGFPRKTTFASVDWCRGPPFGPSGHAFPPPLKSRLTTLLLIARASTATCAAPRDRRSRVLSPVCRAHLLEYTFGAPRKINSLGYSSSTMAVTTARRHLVGNVVRELRVVADQRVEHEAELAAVERLQRRPHLRRTTAHCAAPMGPEGRQVTSRSDRVDTPSHRRTTAWLHRCTVATCRPLQPPNCCTAAPLYVVAIAGALCAVRMIAPFMVAWFALFVARLRAYIRACCSAAPSAPCPKSTCRASTLTAAAQPREGRASPTYSAKQPLRSIDCSHH